MGHLAGALERSMQEQPPVDQSDLPAATDQPKAQPEPVPEPYTGPVARCGTLVRFFLRPNEWRAGRREFPALVMKAGERGAADLLVFLEAQDFWDQRDVPALPGNTGDYGWTPVNTIEPVDLPFTNEGTEALDQIAALKADLGEILFGPYVKPDAPIVGQLSDLQGHVAAILERLDQIDGRLSAIPQPTAADTPPADQSSGRGTRRRDRRG